MELTIGAEYIPAESLLMVQIGTRTCANAVTYHGRSDGEFYKFKKAIILLLSLITY